MTYNRKGSATVVLLVVLVVILAGVLVYFGYLKKPGEVAVGPTLTDVTAGWKIYQNEEYGFEVRYAKNYFLTESKSGISIESSQICKKVQEGSQWPKNCFIYNLSIQKNKITIEGLGINKTVTQISGYPAEKIEDNNPGMIDGLYQIYVQFNKDGYWYVSYLSYNLENKTAAENFFNQVLSTFKFTSTP